MTWCNEENARSRFVLAMSAIHCRVVDRLVGRSVPSRVSRQWLSSVTPPFPPVGPGEPGSPPSSVLCRRYDFPHAHPWSLMCSLPGSICSSDVRVRRDAPGAAEDCREPGPVVQPASRFRHACTWTRVGSLRLPGDPSRPFALFFQTPAEPIRPRLYRPHRCCPRSQHAEGFSAILISRLTQGFGTCCPPYTGSAAAAHARLASGWRAAPLPGGGRTLWITSKGFRLTCPPPFQDLILTQAGPTCDAGSSISP